VTAAPPLCALVCAPSTCRVPCRWAPSGGRTPRHAQTLRPRWDLATTRTTACSASSPAPPRRRPRKPSASRTPTTWGVTTAHGIPHVRGPPRHPDSPAWRLPHHWRLPPCPATTTAPHELPPAEQPRTRLPTRSTGSTSLLHALATRPGQRARRPAREHAGACAFQRPACRLVGAVEAAAAASAASAGVHRTDRWPRWVPRWAVRTRAEVSTSLPPWQQSMRVAC